MNQKKESNEFSRKYLALFFVALLLVGLIWLMSSKEKESAEITPPDSLKAPLYQNLEITNIAFTEPSQQTIIFISSGSTKEIFNFYENWAKENYFVFVDESESNAFSLLPEIGSGHLDYHFSLEIKDNATKVVISYSEPLPNLNPENLIEIPEGLRISF